jgi:predicted chitinase
MPVTTEQLVRIMPHASRKKLTDWLGALNEAMAAYEINTALRMAAFVSQLAHESGEFNFMSELWGPTPAQKRYEPVTDLSKRLGNKEAGDGYRYRGRGPIQITGRANYQRYGELLGLDLVAQPDLAATPEVGFRIAALYWQTNGLNACADKGLFKLITKRINGGYNGLPQRVAFYQAALAALGAKLPAGNDLMVAAGKAPSKAMLKAAGQVPEQTLPRGFEAVAAAGEAKGKAGKKAAPASPSLPPLNVRPDTLDFRDRMYVPTLVEVPTHLPLGDYIDHGVPILDQGTEGACTGFGLATVANYLLRRRRVMPDAVPVSAKMFYDLARRYDEWPGENYSGSSARGAMKGWHKHGVCPEALYPSGTRKKTVLDEARAVEARQRPLGAYFRVNHKDLVAMHAAIAEVGILYATASVHEGWSQVGEDGAITLSDTMIGGHAFAIVAYDQDGFWLQNSWGPTWGKGGFAHISYDDWLRNGTDVWVARLGAPVTLRTEAGVAALSTAATAASASHAIVDLRPHIVSVGNQGQLRQGGDYGMDAEDLAQIFESDIPRITAGWNKVRVLLYAHGGLVPESSAIQRLADYRPALLKGEVYPLAFIWKTDYWTTLVNILEDAMRRRRPEGFLDAAKDFMLDRLDDALEPLARKLTGKAAWDEMKENALATSQPGAAGDLVVTHLEKLRKQLGDKLEIHIVGHSAGSILHAGMISRLLKAKFTIETCTLWAPACTVKVFNEHYAAPIQAERIKRFNLFVLSDQTEQDDNCARIYNKSLLYLVSDAFEDKPRIPGFRDGEPILGMERWIRKELGWLLKHPGCKVVLSPSQVAVGGLKSQARHHGDFDDDPDTVASTFAAITGATAAAAGAELSFKPSVDHLRERRLSLDLRTTARRAG